MNDERWAMLVDQAKKNFDDVSLSTEDLYVPTGEGDVKQGTQDILEFTNEKGTFRIIRENKPALIDKKMHYSHRAGDAAKTEYVFSDTETVHHVRFFKQDYAGDWEEIESENLNFV